MSKCENCIKSDVCVHRANIKNDTYAYMGVTYDTENCPHCKDKSLFVEVVRCKECIHRNKPVRCALWYATVGNVEYFTDRGEDFYCEWGETQEQAERKLREVGE